MACISSVGSYNQHHSLVPSPWRNSLMLSLIVSHPFHLLLNRNIHWSALYLSNFVILRILYKWKCTVYNPLKLAFFTPYNVLVVAVVQTLCLTLYYLMDCSMPGFLFFTIPGACSNSCPLSQWCYLTILSSAALFSFCLQSFPASESLTVNLLFTWVAKVIGAFQHQSFQWVFRVDFL